MKKLVKVKDYDQFEQTIEEYSRSSFTPKYVTTLEGDVFFRLLYAHAGAYLAFKADREDSAGRSIYDTLNEEELVNRIANIAELAVDRVKNSGWLEPTVGECEANEILNVALRIQKE